MKKNIDQNEYVLSNEGYCPICQSKSLFIATHPWLRDYYICKQCHTCPRQRAMALVLQNLVPGWREMSIHEGSPCIPFFSNECKNYSSSYYFPKIQPGEMDPASGKRCENFENMTFPDDTFDILMHMDVLEHVFSPGLAVQEAMRVLKPGGLHIFTAPKNKRLLSSEPRATMQDGQIRHIKSPLYHGDPKDKNGVLVTWDYGADFEDLFSAFSGYLVNTHVFRDRRYGIDGEYLDVFFSWKTPENQQTVRECEDLLRAWPHGAGYLPMIQAAQPEFRGEVRHICKDYVYGYCMNAKFPNRPVCLQVFADSDQLGSVWANMDDPNLKRLGIGSGQNAFYYKFTENQKNLDLSKIVVVPVGGTHPLKPTWVTEEKNDRNQLSEKTAQLAFEYTNIFIVNHIPKAAGTSLRIALEDVFSEQKRLYNYKAIGICSSEIWRWKFADNPDMEFDDVVKHIVEKQIHLVMGHFGHPERYGFDHFVRAFPKGHSVVFLREPHAFICSLYVFARNNFGVNISFEEFIEKDYTQNYQTDHLCGVTLDKISMVGILERYNESLMILSKKIGFCLNVEHHNVNMDNMESSYDFGRFGDKKVWERFDALNQTDIQLYHEAVERFEIDLQKLIV